MKNDDDLKTMLDDKRFQALVVEAAKRNVRTIAFAGRRLRRVAQTESGVPRLDYGMDLAEA
jgi:hypothetical protein